jgi:hypothetical protein
MERRRTYGLEIITDWDKTLQIKRMDGGGTIRELVIKMVLLMTYVKGDLTNKHRKAAVIQQFIFVLIILYSL